MREIDPTASEFISSGYTQRSVPGGLLFDVGSIAGGVIGAFGSSSAAKKQQRAAEAATVAQRQMFDEQMQLNEPYRYAGEQANNKLLDLLGIRSSGQTRAYNELFDKFYQEDKAAFNAAHAQNHGFGIDDAPAWAKSDLMAQDRRIREAAKMRAEKESASMGGTPGDSFGSLMRRFSMSDFEADPGYQFRMDEGMRGVEGGAAARGGLLSGAALKAIQKYGQGLASEEYGRAYGRFTADQTNQYNRLAGLVNTGQGATNQLTNAAGQFGQSQANNIIGAGNAQASGIMGATNAITGGINQWMNTNNQNQLMNLIRQPAAGGWGGGSSLVGMKPTAESYYGY